MGLLPDVAASLHVTIPQAGYLVSATPWAWSSARRSWPSPRGIARKTALLALMALFIIGNLGCALAPGYGLLMAARIVTAFAHGAFFGIGAVVASDLVAREQRAQAISLMFAGLTLANVLGVPLGRRSDRPQDGVRRSGLWSRSGSSPALPLSVTFRPECPAVAADWHANSVLSAAGRCFCRC